MYQTQYEGLSNGGFLKHIKLYQISSNTLHAPHVHGGISWAPNPFRVGGRRASAPKATPAGGRSTE